MKVLIVVTLTMMAALPINVYGCLDDEYDCGNGQCVPASYRCDGEADCPTAIDELDCGGLCGAGRFNCTSNGQCAKKCDGSNNCPGPDGSDEIGCDGTCHDGKFHCGDNDPECIYHEQRCNGINDCVKSLADESGICRSCAGTVYPGGPSRVNCTSSGKCVDACDGHVDCPGPDGSDEIGCDGTCYDGKFHCGSRDPECIPRDQKCDGRANCWKGSTDELNCGELCAGTSYPAGPEKVICADNKLCVKRCNGVKDCDDASDEKGCNGTCYDDRIHCGEDHELCVRHKYRCDGEQSCWDGRDEKGCGEDCSGRSSKSGPELINCTDGSCGRKCDARIDCPNGEDENPILCKNRCWNGSYHCGLTNLGCRGSKERCKLDQSPKIYN